MKCACKITAVPQIHSLIQEADTSKVKKLEGLWSLHHELEEDMDFREYEED